MARSGNHMNGNVNGGTAAPRPLRDEPSDEAIRDQDALLDDVDDEDYGRTSGNGVRDESRPFIAQREFQENLDEQADFREQFDEDLYNDRAEAPVQGNTADVAMGDHRFGTDAEAYTEYAHRRPGEDSTVGQSRDPADISDEEDEQS